MNAGVRLIFVYNADGGFLNLLSDISHKIFSPQDYNCNLCSVTHGYFTKRRKWRKFLSTLRVETEFLHRDEFRQRYPESNVAFPAVLRDAGGQLEICLDAATVNNCGDLTELEALISGKCLCEEES